ncbi:IclR family transcriptional regulator [Mesorhizobium sp. J18]|uniref:IclR family transcriptional regulator n=1 Tax=Mesorhizobium sp. J18 TaxID=935263 RepID=UPI001199FEA6|nr:IclR family transcriptional regulator [Mesorhizobium sp. J18]TWG99499.1 IclR family transcriptional regulator [Mesorhizobium sp. J18]
MSGVMERSLAIIELLADEPDGLPVTTIAARLDLPASAAHRLLNELARFGYVRQDRAQGNYALTLKLAAMGLSFLGHTGVTDIAQPILDQLAQQSGELIRLSVVDGRNLVWVAVAQGTTKGLRYDPSREQGVVVHLAASAGGRAFLSTMSDEEALMLVAEQGFDSKTEQLGPKAPKTASEVLAILHETRQRSYSVAVDSYIDGMAAMAVPIRYANKGVVVGCLSIAGPAVRMTSERMKELAPALHAAANELGAAGRASRYFQRVKAESESAGESTDRQSA